MYLGCPNLFHGRSATNLRSYINNTIEAEAVPTTGAVRKAG